MGSDYLVSLIIPAYNSIETIEESLLSFISQDYADLEIIVVDSSPNNDTEQLMNSKFPNIRYFHSKSRLLPHAARNFGVKKSRGEVLVFSDPDIYAPSNWISKMVNAWTENKHVIIGGLKCHNTDYFKRGVHLVKFDLWLPGGKKRPIKIAPTANMLVDKLTFEEVGPFKTQEMLGDTIFSWELEARNKTILFVPQNWVSHDHVCTLKQFLKERLARGRDFGRLRLDRENFSFNKKMLTMIISLIPLRLLKLQFRILRNSFNASRTFDFIVGQPMIILGWYMWLIGECQAYLKAKE